MKSLPLVALPAPFLEHLPGDPKLPSRNSNRGFFFLFFSSFFSFSSTLEKLLSMMRRMSFKQTSPPRFALLNWKGWKGQQAYSRVQAARDDELTDNDEVETIFAASSPSLCSPRNVLVYAFFFYMLLSSGALLYKAFSPTSHPEATSVIIHTPCGGTPAEARASDCIFDIIAFSWLPPRCYDAELAEEFRELKGWEYFLDRNRTRPLSQELALTGEFAGLYTEFEYHLRHCTFLWKKMHRALLSGGGGKPSIDSVTAGYAHTEHCSHMLMTRREVALDIINAVIVVKYPDCGMA